MKCKAFLINRSPTLPRGLCALAARALCARRAGFLRRLADNEMQGFFINRSPTLSQGFEGTPFGKGGGLNKIRQKCGHPPPFPTGFPSSSLSPLPIPLLPAFFADTSGFVVLIQQGDRCKAFNADRAYRRLAETQHWYSST